MEHPDGLVRDRFLAGRDRHRIELGQAAAFDRVDYLDAAISKLAFPPAAVVLIEVTRSVAKRSR